MSFVQGVVQAVSSNIRPFQTKFGMAYNLSFKMPDGQWYRLKFCKVDEPAPLQAGMEVAFSYEMNHRTNQQTGQPIVDLEVNKKNLQILNGSNGMQQQQPQAQMPPQGGYQQPHPQQGGYPQQQAPVPQQPQQPQLNWVGKEGMATGMALQCASHLCSDINEVPAMMARILLLQQEVIQNLTGPDHGMGYLQQMAGQQVPSQQPQQPPQAPAPQQAQMPTPQPQQAPQAPQVQQNAPQSPMPGGGFGSNPPPMNPQQDYTGG